MEKAPEYVDELPEVESVVVLRGTLE